MRVSDVLVAWVTGLIVAGEAYVLVTDGAPLAMVALAVAGNGVVWIGVGLTTRVWWRGRRARRVAWRR